MKRFTFLLSFLAVIMVVAVSCTTMRGPYDDYYEDGAPRRNVYVDPYYNGSAVILERDPYTGRYYEVVPGGYYQGNVAPYGYGYGNRYYRNYNNNRNNNNYQRDRDRDYDNRNNNRGRDDDNRNNRTNNNNYQRRENTGTYQRPSQNNVQQNQPQQQNREEARNKILGNHR